MPVLMRSALLATAALLGGMASAAAAPALGLVGDRTLVRFDTGDQLVSEIIEVAGVGRLLGIDLRPSNGRVYGVAADGRVVTIDLETGSASPVATLDRLVPAGAPVIVDFNPAADKLRFMSGTTNLRADVDSGKVVEDGSLAFEGTDMHAGERPAIVAAAYINSYAKPEKTAMYDIDATIVALIRQVSPNDGTLAAIGKLGIPAAGDYAFDVQTSSAGENTAWLVADNLLYRIDLSSGKAAEAGPIAGAPGPIRDVAVLPGN